MFKFVDEDSARETIEKILWPNGAVCPHCHNTIAYKLTPNPKSTRPVRKGVYKCSKCRKQFTVTVGTVFSDSHIPLGKWLMAIHLLCSSKKGMSAHQLHRLLGINYRSAWFMAHRIRHAMGPKSQWQKKLSGIVEVDETYIGGKASRKKGTGFQNKTAVVALVQRGSTVRSQAMEKISGNKVKQAIRENVDLQAHLMTDQAPFYKGIGKEYASHDRIRHNIGQYVSGDVSTNTVEGYFSLVKRGIEGIYHHVGRQHLQKYLDEFNFRYNTRKTSDYSRSIEAIRGAEGKRLVLREAA